MELLAALDRQLRCCEICEQLHEPVSGHKQWRASQLRMREARTTELAQWRLWTDLHGRGLALGPAQP
jgi:hypothetical protein